MVESDIILLYIWSCIWGIISTMGPSVALYRPHGGLFPVMAAEGPRHSHRRRVGGIVLVVHRVDNLVVMTAMP
jgi:hypothetical protein